jgi:hypothetical protein
VAENIQIRRLYSCRSRLVLSSSFSLIGTGTVDLLLALCILRVYFIAPGAGAGKERSVPAGVPVTLPNFKRITTYG